MNIPSAYYKTDTIYRSLTGTRRNGELGCGFMYKPDSTFTSTYCFDYYGAFLLLDGSGALPALALFLPAAALLFLPLRGALPGDGGGHGGDS